MTQRVTAPQGPAHEPLVGEAVPRITPLAPIAWEAMENAMVLFFHSVTGLAVIWEDQKIQRPAYPYGTIRSIAGPTPKGIDETRVQEDAVMLSCGDRDWTVSFKVLGEPGKITPSSHARAFIGAVVAAFAVPSMNKILQDGGLAVREIMPVSLPDEQIADTWISRAALDVRFGIASNVSQQIDIIETAVPVDTSEE